MITSLISCYIFMVVDGGWEMAGGEWGGSGGGGREGGRCLRRGSDIWRKTHGQK